MNWAWIITGAASGAAIGLLFWVGYLIRENGKLRDKNAALKSDQEYVQNRRHASIRTDWWFLQYTSEVQKERDELRQRVRQLSEQTTVPGLRRDEFGKWCIQDISAFTDWFVENVPNLSELHFKIEFPGKGRGLHSWEQ